MHHYKLTILRDTRPLGGELIFDENKISFRNDPIIPGFSMFTLAIMIIGNGYIAYKHMSDIDPFFYILHAIITLWALIFFFYTCKQFALARKTHQMEFLPKDLDLVYLLKGKKKIEFIFDFNNGRQQSFKTRNGSKSKQFIDFLKSEHVDIL